MEVTQIPLNQMVVQGIQNWLKLPEARAFLDLMATLEALEEAEAAAALKESNGDDGLHTDAMTHMDLARRYEFFQHVLISARDGVSPEKATDKFPYCSLKITPRTITQSK